LRRLMSVLILFMFVVVPVFVKADTKSYSIDRLVENAMINEVGDIEIHEEFTYSFKGEFNGIYRNLLKNGAKSFALLEVAVKDSEGKVTPIFLGSDSQSNTYQLSEDGNAWNIKLFNKSNNEEKTFIFRYIIQGAAVKTEASGELYWNFYSVENNNTVKNVELNLALKNTDFNMDKFKYWSYVEGNDFTTNYDTKGLHIKGKDLTALLGIRVLFQTEFLKIPLPTKNDSSPNNYNSSSNYNSNSNYSSQYNISTRGNENNTAMLSLFLIAAIIAGVFIYYSYQCNKKFQEALSLYRAQGIRFNQEIYTTPPSDVSPALVRVLVYENSLSLSMIPATLFYLSKKGYYLLEKRTYEKSGLFRKTQDEDLAFIKNHQLTMPEAPHLQYFMSWLSLYEDRGCFTLKSIEEQVSNRSGALTFKDQFSEWERIIRQEGCDLGFYTNIQGKQVLSNKYYDEQLKWLAYKKYLLGQINNNIGSAAIGALDDVLIYAQALEIGSDPLESLSQELNSYSTYDIDPHHRDLYHQNMHYLYPFFFMNLHIWDNINNNINQNSDNSDPGGTNSFTGGDGGSFGGFSDGGGFSGGGGGDSGAF
jgi:uncharacterized membrane protein YgcG